MLLIRKDQYLFFPEFQIYSLRGTRNPSRQSLTTTMSQNISDTAYIQANPNCIGEHFIKIRGEIFRHIEEIAKEMGTIAKAASIEKSPRKLRAGEWYQNVVSIIGERGSGKTVLLLSACACLEKDINTHATSYYYEGSGKIIQVERSGAEIVRIEGSGMHYFQVQGEPAENKYEHIKQKVSGDILLPIIQPEYFGQEDTLITWVLTYLKEYLEAKDKKEEFQKIKIKQDDDDENDEGVRLLDFIEELRQDEALFSRKFASNLAEQDITAVDFQRETVAVIDAHSRFMRNWRKLIKHLIVKEEKHRTSTERQDHPFLIIPIDDADLNPVALPVILQQLQLLQDPNVLFLFSAHEQSLRSMMYISLLELNTNRVSTRPVVNFENLIKHKLRDVENIRADGLAKIDKFLPRKYRVEIPSLSKRERLNFKPLVNNKDDKTFLGLLEQIPLNIFENRRLENLAQFFDLAQFFKRCPLDISKDSSIKFFCEVCKLQSKDAELPCRNPEFRDQYNKYKKTMQPETKDEPAEKAKEYFGVLLPPIPSIYADALPKYPRAMEQVYKILSYYVSDIKPLLDKRAKEETDETEKEKIDTMLRAKIAQLAKKLITACREYVPLLPRAFHQRIEFIDNPNTSSKHPILIAFGTDGLENIINADGETIEINASTHDKSPRILCIHPISDYLMLIQTKIKKKGEGVEQKYRIPDEWTYYNTTDPKKDKEGRTITRHHVPDEYFAVYNLAYDLTTSHGVFGRTNNTNQYQMRDGSPVTIFSVQARTATQFTDCYCVMPRWHRIADYNLFAMAWNDLVQHVGEIMSNLGSANIMPNNHILSDWVMLSLLRIHICLEMNYSPFLITEKETQLVIDKIRDDRSNPKKGGAQECYGDLIKSMKYFVKQGLRSTMEHIKLEAQKHALPKHHQAFRAWVEYGLPMLSTGDYVSPPPESNASESSAPKSDNLGAWIANQWVMLLLTNDDPISGREHKKDSCGNDQKCRHNVEQAVHSKYGISIQWKEGVLPTIASESKVPEIGKTNKKPISRAKEDLKSPQNTGTNPSGESLAPDCESCAIVQLALIAALLNGLPQDDKRKEEEKKKAETSVRDSIHPSQYFLREYLPQQAQGFHTARETTKALYNKLEWLFTLWHVGDDRSLVKAINEWKTPSDHKDHEV